MIYLDYNATTPIDKEVADAMLPYLYGNFGNPSSSHVLGANAKIAIEKARSQVAALLNASEDEIVFTSGGSESNNTLLKGVAYTFKNKGNHIITSQIEHPAILKPCKYLEGLGYEVSYVPVNCINSCRYNRISSLSRSFLSLRHLSIKMHRTAINSRLMAQTAHHGENIS